MRSLFWSLALIAACDTPSQTDPDTQIPDSEAITLELEMVGPSLEEANAYRAAFMVQAEILATVGEHRAGLLHFELLPAPDAELGFLTTSYEAIFYDYETNQAYMAHGDMADEAEAIIVAESDYAPSPTFEEFDIARELALQDADLAQRYADGQVDFFQAMPPLIGNDEGDRIVSLGIRDLDAGTETEITGANISAQLIIHYPDRAPPTAQVVGFVCNPPSSSFQSGTGQGVQGWARLRLRQGGQEVWSMYVRRPSASSGPNGSGLELYDVRYQTKPMLQQAHVPILNVQYENDSCGPYRDWQYQENPFEIGPVLANVGPGIVVAEWAKTIRELRDDTGNHYGIAAYWDAAQQEAVVISELAAGWYRYQSEWRFKMDGTLRPMFGFDAVENGCTCRRHNHHSYWRMDFNIGSGDNTVEEYDDLTGVWTPITSEYQQVRDDSVNRRWRVIDNVTGDSVLVEPDGAEDGADAYGIADLWVLKDNPGEIDDSNAPRAPVRTQANLPYFVDGESVAQEDLVMWWGGHFIHEEADPATNQTHTVKFRITPENW